VRQGHKKIKHARRLRTFAIQLTHNNSHFSPRKEQELELPYPEFLKQPYNASTDIATKKCRQNSWGKGLEEAFRSPYQAFSHTATNFLDAQTSEGTSRRIPHAYVQAVSHCSPPNSHIALCHHGNKFPVINAPILIKENRKRAVTVHVEAVGHIYCVHNVEVVNSLI
jgi:hypothetical protein